MARSCLTRNQIVETLDRGGPEQSLGIGPQARKALTGKQKAFAHYVACGMSKAAAYRAAYDSRAKPATQSQSGCRLAADPRIAAQIAAFEATAEAKRYATAAALRSLVIEQLTALAVDEGVNTAQRLQALELLGKVTEVAAFTERREVVKVTDSGSARDRLIEALRSAVRASAIDADQVLEIRSEPDTIESERPGEGLSESAGDPAVHPHPPESGGLRSHP